MKVISKISEGILTSVETFYQTNYSNPVENNFVFAYRITIENHNSFPVKLLRRHWHIFDSNGTYKEVEGDGVVGIQPIIQSTEKHQYVSSCSLHSEMGRMSGTYQMENLNTQKLFSVIIPSFELIAPLKMN